MVIEQIITKRNYESDPCWDLVYEWEDEISQCLNISLSYEKKTITNSRIINKIFKKFPLLSILIKTTKKSFVFEMSECRSSSYYNASNFFPCIIDGYFANEWEIMRFRQAYSNNKVVFISSKQVFDYLSNYTFPFTIKHLPLSIPSKYKLEDNSCFAKRYNLAIIGRTNPVLSSFAYEYHRNHPSFNYIYNKKEGNKYVYYLSSGERIGELRSRVDYFNLLKQCKIGLYSTSGMDNDKVSHNNEIIDTNEFHQVTPRLLEMIACGCHIIARYSPNPDTDYFEMDKICKRVEDYSDFEEAVDSAMAETVNLAEYAAYLNKHYTSVVASSLYILNKL